MEQTQHDKVFLSLARNQTSENCGVEGVAPFNQGENIRIPNVIARLKSGSKIDAYDRQTSVMINLVGAILMKDEISQISSHRLDEWFELLRNYNADLDLPFARGGRLHFPLGFAIERGLEQSVIHLLRGGAAHVDLCVRVDHRHTAPLLEFIAKEWIGVLPGRVCKAVKWRCRSELAQIHAAVVRGWLRAKNQGGVVEKVIGHAIFFREVIQYL